MGKIKIIKTSIEGLLVLEPQIFKDERGYFAETYNQKDLEEAGISTRFVQDNESLSTKGVLRGLHFQKQHPQSKLIRVVEGKIFDVAVDLRPGSKTYGRWEGFEISSQNHRQVFIPEGFAHGFLVLSDSALVLYKCSDFYHPEDEGGIAYNDPALAIKWPDPLCPLSLSPKDSSWPNLI